MFNRKKFKPPSLPGASNVRKTKEERKTRSDKKFDIKIPLDENQLKVFRLLAYNRGMTPTAFAAYLVVKGMDYNLDFDEVEYENHPEIGRASWRERV